jgi:hypothetical protein
MLNSVPALSNMVGKLYCQRAALLPYLKEILNKEEIFSRDNKERCLFYLGS